MESTQCKIWVELISTHFMATANMTHTHTHKKNEKGKMSTLPQALSNWVLIFVCFPPGFPLTSGVRYIFYSCALSQIRLSCHMFKIFSSLIYLLLFFSLLRNNRARSTEETCVCMPVSWTVKGNFKRNESLLKNADWFKHRRLKITLWIPVTSAVQHKSKVDA